MLLRVIGGLISIAAKAEPYILKFISPAYKVGVALKENAAKNVALAKRATVEASAEENKDKTKPTLGNKKASNKKSNTVSKKSKTSIRKKRKNFINVLKKVSPDAVKSKISKKDLKDKNLGFKEILLSGRDNLDTSQSEQDLFEAIGSMRKARQSRRLIDVLESALKDSLGEIGAEYNEGKLSAKDFKAKAKDALKGFHVASMIVGAGGIKNLSQNNLSQLSETLEKQYKYFDRFAEKKLGVTTGINTIGSKDHRINAKNMSSLRAYASSIKGTYEMAEAQVMSASEYEVEERRVATASESCEDCVLYASEGWQPLGTLAEIGDSQCGIYCKCYFEYRDRKRKK